MEADVWLWNIFAKHIIMAEAIYWVDRICFHHILSHHHTPTSSQPELSILVGSLLPANVWFFSTVQFQLCPQILPQILPDENWIQTKLLLNDNSASQPVNSGWLVFFPPTCDTRQLTGGPASPPPWLAPRSWHPPDQGAKWWRRMSRRRRGRTCAGTTSSSAGPSPRASLSSSSSLLSVSLSDSLRTDLVRFNTNSLPFSICLMWCRYWVQNLKDKNVRFSAARSVSQIIQTKFTYSSLCIFSEQLHCCYVTESLLFLTKC